MEVLVTLTGVQSQLMHNGELANPFNPWAQKLKQLNAKKPKTEEDLLLIAETEFNGSLYFSDGIGPFWPDKNLFALIRDAGIKLRKRKLVETAVKILNPVNPLVYDGPRDRDGLWSDKRFVHACMAKVPPRTGSMVLRTRPEFKQWTVPVLVHVDTKQMDPALFREIIDIASKFIGLSDWRPIHGLFDYTIEGLK